MRARTTLLLVAAAAGLGYGLWRMPVTQRFVSTARTAAARREAELREAIEVAVVADATGRAPRHSPDAVLPTSDIEAGWDRDPQARRAAAGLGADDPGRSLTPEEARALLHDPTGERAP
ncbi:MAG: hypothetical protein WBL35_13530 [Ornithinibacter sp.]